jgi:cyanophycin synthetase
MRSPGSHLLSLGRYYRFTRGVLGARPCFEASRRDLYRRYWTAAAAQLDGRVDQQPDDYLRVTVGDRSTLVHFHHVNIDTYLNYLLLANKAIVHRLLEEHGYPTPRFVEYALTDQATAGRFMATVGGRCVVKPGSGSGGSGITTGVDSKRRLRSASLAASAYTRRNLVIEEELPGDSYRLLFLGGELVDAVRRRRPTVVGDAERSIAELIERENEVRLLSQPARSFTCIEADLDCRLRLDDHGIGLSYVPTDGETVVVKNVANQNERRDNLSVLGDVHPYFHELGRRVSGVFGLNLVGVDIMTPDVSVPLTGNGGAINELNIPPGLHYHELVANPEGRPDVGRQILAFVFSGSGSDLAVPTRQEGSDASPR